MLLQFSETLFITLKHSLTMKLKMLSCSRDVFFDILGVKIVCKTCENKTFLEGHQNLTKGSGEPISFLK